MPRQYELKKFRPKSGILASLWRKDDRASRKAGEESPGSRKQGAERKLGTDLGETLSLASTEPQKLCRFFYPKGKRKRVKRGNPPRCNLRMGRLRTLSQVPRFEGGPQGPDAFNAFEMDDHRETEPGLLIFRVQRTTERWFFVGVIYSLLKKYSLAST